MERTALDAGQFLQVMAQPLLWGQQWEMGFRDQKVFR